MLTVKNLDFAQNDLMDVVRLFEGAENLRLSLDFSMDKELEIFIDLNGEAHNFSYPLDGMTGGLEKKRLLKRYAKLSLYRVLSKHFNITLPWGALTGIRPVKFAYNLQKEGKNYIDYMKNEMFCEENRVKLVFDIIQMQEGIYTPKEGMTDFFVGIPFCPSRCAYCSFISCETKAAAGYLGEYTDALCREITAAKAHIKNLRSVYIGGGTPVSLPIEYLTKILNAVGEVNVEYSVEAGRPDCITEDILSLLKSYNVTRICINPQTFNDKTLEIIGRKHTAKDVCEKYELAKKIGFDVNMDLIAGLPGESFEDFKSSIDKAASLLPQNITVHTLALKKGSKFKESTSRLAAGETGRMLDYSRERLYEAGYKPYYMYRQKYMSGNFENVGYSLADKQCVYNIDVMEEIADNIACGANAISKRVYPHERIERYKNPKDVKTYLSKVQTIIAEKDDFFS